MKNFLNMITRISNENYNKFIEHLQMDKVSCGYFVGSNLTHEHVDIVTQLVQSGINVEEIIMPDGGVFEVPINLPMVNMSSIKDKCDAPKHILMIPAGYNIIFLDYFLNRQIDVRILCEPMEADMGYMNIINHITDLYDVYQSFGDELSKAIFLQDIIGDTVRSYGEFIFAPESQYMLAGFMPERGDIAIDGGAYDGGTGKTFSQLGAHVYGFELDNDNFIECLRVAGQYGFTAENLGLWSAKKTSMFRACGTASRISEYGEMEASLTSIDLYMQENHIPRLDYIKLDVEGAELEVLKGAVKGISMFKPKMAISAYHKQEDLWELMAYIKSIRSDYEFAWRHYAVDVSDYWLNESELKVRRFYGMSDTVSGSWEKVLYCR